MIQPFHAHAASTRGDVGAAQPSFRIVLRDGVAVLQCAGPIDMSAEERFRRELHVAFAQCEHVVVDLSGVSFIDCAGLRCLADFRTEVEGAAGRICLVVNGRAVGRLFELAGVTFPAAQSVLEAQLALDGVADAS